MSNYFMFRSPYSLDKATPGEEHNDVFTLLRAFTTPSPNQILGKGRENKNEFGILILCLVVCWL